MQADNKTVSVGLKKSEDAGIINNQQASLTFKYDTILQNTSQDGVFTQCATEVVDNVINGYNGTIFAYGQTAGHRALHSLPFFQLHFSFSSAQLI